MPCECEQKVSSVVSVLTSDIYLCEFNSLHSFYAQSSWLLWEFFVPTSAIFFVDTSAPEYVSNHSLPTPNPYIMQSTLDYERVATIYVTPRHATPLIMQRTTDYAGIFRAYMRTQHNVEKVKKKISPQHMCKEYIEYIMLRGCQIFSLYRGNLQTFCRLLT